MFIIQNMVHAALASDTKEISQSLSYRLILGTMQDFQNKVSVALELYILEDSPDAKKTSKIMRQKSQRRLRKAKMISPYQNLYPSA